MQNPKFSQIKFAITDARWGLVARWGLSLIMLGLALGFFASTAHAQDPCDADNLIWNCRFDSFTGAPPRQVPEGWSPFIVAGDLTYMQDSDSFFGAPALRMWSNGGTFTAGILTQVGNVQPGATYEASWGWGGPNEPDTFGRKLGIDPTGGTDPLSGNVVWGPLHYGPGRILNRPGPYSPDNANLNVSVVARASTVTVFVWVEHPRSTGDNLIFVDQVGLRQNSSQPIVAPPTATPLPPPPTATPSAAAIVAPAAARVAATATAQPPTPAPTDVPATATATFTATSTPSPTPTTTPTATATPTVTATATPPPTPLPTLAARPTATALPFYTQFSRASQRQPALLLYSGFGSLVLAAGAALLLWSLLRRR